MAGLGQQPDTARPLLAALLVDPAASVRARVWAMLAVCQIKDDERGLASKAVARCANATEAIVRRSAIETLGVLKVEWAVALIADHLTDHEAIPEAWFDDDATPAQAARRALASIGTPEAMRVLASSPGK